MEGACAISKEVGVKPAWELQQKGLGTDGDTIKVLIKYLAGTLLFLEFEQIHNLIFGSQILLLKKLALQIPCCQNAISFLLKSGSNGI